VVFLQEILCGGGVVGGLVSPFGDGVDRDRRGEHGCREEQVSDDAVAEEWDASVVAGEQAGDRSRIQVPGGPDGEVTYQKE